MTLALLFTGTAQCHSLIQRHIISDYGSLTYNYTGSVIYKKSFTYRSSRMYLYTGPSDRTLWHQSGQEIMFFKIKLMCHTMPYNSPEARIKQYFRIRPDSGIALFYNLYLYDKIQIWMKTK